MDLNNKHMWVLSSPRIYMRIIQDNSARKVISIRSTLALILGHRILLISFLSTLQIDLGKTLDDEDREQSIFTP